MKIIVTAFALMLLLTGCDNKCCTIYSTDIILKFQNSNGENLLDPSTSNALKKEDIEVYVLKKGARILLFDNGIHAPKNFEIYGSSTQSYYLKFYFNIAEEYFTEKKVTMFLKYKDGSEDKLVGEFNNNKGTNIMLQNVWINDIAMGSRSQAFILKK